MTTMTPKMKTPHQYLIQPKVVLRAGVVYRFRATLEHQIGVGSRVECGDEAVVVFIYPRGSRDKVVWSAHCVGSLERLLDQVSEQLGTESKGAALHPERVPLAWPCLMIRFHLASTAFGTLLISRDDWAQIPMVGRCS